MTGVPDLGRLVQEATHEPEPWAYMVSVPTTEGPQTVPVSVGVFLMLDAIAGQLTILNTKLEQLVVQDAVKP